MTTPFSLVCPMVLPALRDGALLLAVTKTLVFLGALALAPSSPHLPIPSQFAPLARSTCPKAQRHFHQTLGVSELIADFLSGMVLTGPATHDPKAAARAFLPAAPHPPPLAVCYSQILPVAFVMGPSTESPMCTHYNTF